jgi:transposase
MMGSQRSGQARLFYSFNLEDHVPANHLLRGIDRFLDLDSLREHLGPFYSHTGRPSIAPELTTRMLIIGYCFGIRSERRLCEEVQLNLAYRWFCRLSLEDEVPDHSTFSKNRHGRFRDSDVLRHAYETVLRRASTRTMIDRVEQRLQLKPQRLVGDTAYGTASLLGWMVEEKAIEPQSGFAIADIQRCLALQMLSVTCRFAKTSLAANSFRSAYNNRR